ncbi:MAG TPA: hypothetical protein PLI41_05320 [Bacteroidales bacterium]|jgi:hypothetical protein|nr:hypothetical protein [Bacteroidales bacterium]
MNPYRISTLVILIVLTVTLSAQKRDRQTVVFDGGFRLRGTILVDSSDYLKLRITTPQVVTLKKSEISYTTRASDIEKPFIDRHGYWIRISASALTGRNDEGNVGNMSFHFSNGYRFRNGISAGIGTGLEELDVTVMPIYADLRYNILKTRLSPFVWLKSGWSFAFGKLNDGQYYYYGYFPQALGGFMFNAGTGIELASWRRNAVSLGMGYRYQKIVYEQIRQWEGRGTNEIITRFNRIEVQLGFIFR